MALASQVLGRLPECVAFQSKENGKYLRYVHESGLFHMSGEDAINPFTRFCVEPSSEHDGLVHIRCCYNNKYWAARNVDGKWWVHGDADEPVEDPSNPSCTLFKPILTEDSMACSLIHQQLGKETLLFRSGVKAEEAGDDLKGGCVQVLVHAPHAGDADAGAMAMALVAVSKQEAVLPRNVCFKGDNDRYLRGVVREGYPYLEFSSEDMGASDVRHITETNRDGRIRMWSVHFSKFWRRSPNWIWADTGSDSWGNPDTQFRAVLVDGSDTFFALRNLGNNKFCKRLTTEGKESCLNAAVDTITRDARMLILETVFSRKIDEVEYQVMDARIYGHRVLAFDSAHGTNTDAHSNHTLSLSFKKVTTESRTWNASVTLKLGVKTALSAGIPLLAEGKVEVSAEFGGSYSWGTTIQETQETSVTYQVVVPPRTKVTVTLLATQATYDVPYYYRQTDVLTDGTTQTSHLYDGIYTGVNAYDFRYETKEEKL